MPKLILLAVILSQIPFIASADVLIVPSEYPTIQAAIDAAEHGDDILIAAGTYRELLDGLNKSLTLIGAGVGQTILSGDLDDDGAADGDTLVINDATADTLPFITITGITFAHADRAIVFGRIADITIAGCRFESCESGAISSRSIPGSGTRIPTIYAQVRDVYITDSEFVGGRSAVGLNASGRNVVILRCDFSNLESSPIGIRCDSFSAYESTFTNNTGGVFLTTLDGTLEDCIFEQNAGSPSCAEIHSSSFIIERCRFQDNGLGSEASNGAIVFRSGSAPGVVVVESTFIGNQGNMGSAITAEGLWRIEDCLFEENIGSTTGPINILGGSILGHSQVTNCQFFNNGSIQSNGTYLPRGGGGLCNESTTIIVEGCVFRGNKAASGGAIYSPGFTWVNNCRFEANRAKGEYATEGGAIKAFLRGSRLGVTNSIFIGNHAEGGGGGAISIRREPFIAGCAFIGNTSNHGSAVQRTYRSDWKRIRSSDDRPIALSASIIIPTGDAASAFASGTGPVQIDIADNIMTTDADSIGFTRVPNDGGDGWGDDPSTPDVDEGANDDFGDLTLLADSSAIDAGDNTNLPIDIYDLDGDGDRDDDLIGTTDLFGNARFADVWSIPNGHDAGAYAGPIDVGPVEYQAEPCLADVNHDFVLDAADFAAWIAAYNNRSPECDQNGDSYCSHDDFSAWMDNFNAGCQ